MTVNETLQAKVEEIRQSVRFTNGPYVEINDMLHLLDVLSAMLCPHKFTGKRAGGDPAEPGSLEMVLVCDLCGMEADIAA